MAASAIAAPAVSAWVSAWLDALLRAPMLLLRLRLREPLRRRRRRVFFAAPGGDDDLSDAGVLAPRLFVDAGAEPLFERLDAFAARRGGPSDFGRPAGTREPSSLEGAAPLPCGFERLLGPWLFSFGLPLLSTARVGAVLVPAPAVAALLADTAAVAAADAVAVALASALGATSVVSASPEPLLALAIVVAEAPA